VNAPNDGNAASFDLPVNAPVFADDEWPDANVHELLQSFGARADVLMG